MALYRSKPQEVQAIQWTGDNVDEVLHAVPDKTMYFSEQDKDCRTSELKLRAGVDGAQEWVPVPVGHWLVHPPGDLSDVWPVEDEYFRNKYEEVAQDPDFAT
jgi:hypothetical protein